MAALVVEGTVPVLLVCADNQVQSEIWLTNPTPGDIKVDSATLSVTFLTGTETGAIQLPADAAIPADSTRRFAVAMGLKPFVAPGSYGAQIDLGTSAGPQSIPATFVVLSRLAVGLAPSNSVFTGIAASTAVSGTVLVRNKGNVAVTVGAIPDAALFEVTAAPRVLGVDGSGAVSVEPAAGLAPLPGTVTFTNSTPTIPVGGWADVTYQFTTPAGLAPDLHVRVLPRIATERFAIDLLTV